MHVKTTKRMSKLDDKSNVRIFISYELGTKAYRCLGPCTFIVSISRDVGFDEYQCWVFNQQGGQCVDFTFTSAIDLVSSSEVSTANEDLYSASDIPPYESVDQGQLFDVEERLERP